MAKPAEADAVLSLVDRLLTEEQEKVAEFIRESHRAVASRLKEGLAEALQGHCLYLENSAGIIDGIVLQMDDREPSAECLGKKLETVTCSNPLREPIGDASSAPLPEKPSDAKPTNTTVEGKVPYPVDAPPLVVDEIPANATIGDLASPTSNHSHHILGDVASSVGHSVHELAERSQSLMKSTSSLKVKRIREQKQASQAQRMINNPMFEVVLVSLIAFNAICMGLEQQYHGMDAGYKLEVLGVNRPAQEVWPNAESWFVGSELFFGVIFTAEVLAKVVILRRDFFKSLWNIYDSVIILCWLVDSLKFLNLPTDPLVMRMARMGRLGRLLRFAKAFQIFDVLHLLIRSLMASVSALMWSVLCLALVMMATAILLIHMLQPEFENESIPLEERLKLYRYFGTFTNGLLAMYELTMAGWVPIARTVIDNAGEGYILFFIAYRTIVGFAVLSVVSSIFNAETFRITQSDDDILVLHRERQTANHVRRVHSLLLEADESHDGVLSFEEFVEVMKDAKIQKWLDAQDIDVSDVELAFQISDVSGDGRLTTEELVGGLAKMKGAATSAEVISVLNTLSRVEQLLSNSIDGALVINKRDDAPTEHGTAAVK
eukprot:TRINITY_DN7812_c0_g4_i1.p1 TRINITY_DN7812_c0_g4~~TRINITY_DN7812_c0_g4_i1.p1  ORF type:complete len:622 (-),score=93.76 TRINITY_DN7812_c0_g4_i1:430-2241(-)